MVSPFYDWEAPCPPPTSRIQDEAALGAALHALRDTYDVVAVLEKMSESLQLLEAVLPRYFISAPQRQVSCGC